MQTIRRTMIVTAVSFVAVLGACSAPTSGQAAMSTAPAPVLGNAGDPHARGFGVARPSTIDPGGDANSIIENITWQDWGGTTATGTGTADWVEPDAPKASATQERATVVASDLGDCHGKQAYRKLGWYFPQHHETSAAHRTTSVCSQ